MMRIALLPSGQLRIVSAVVAVWVSALGGCSVNDRILVGRGTVRYLSNADDTARAIVVQSSGIHMSTFATDAGLTVGRVDRTYFFAGGNSIDPPHAPRGSVAQLDLETVRLSPVDADEGNAWKDAIPLAHVGRREGVTVAANRHQVGLIVGVRQDALIALPKRGSARLLLKVSTTRPSELYMSYRRYPEGSR